MVEKYQLDNPNNARVIIDYKNKNKKVQFFYVGHSSKFKICWKFFLSKWLSFPLMLIPLIPIYIIFLLLLPMNSFYTTASFYFLAFSIILGIPYILALIFSKTKLIRLMPKLQKFSVKCYYADFFPKDIKNNQIEIPLFSNVLLEYKAFKNFANYLEKVEIIEHPFNYFLKDKKKRNEYLWKATFYFSKHPKTGKLKVRFN